MDLRDMVSKLCQYLSLLLQNLFFELEILCFSFTVCYLSLFEDILEHERITHTVILAHTYLECFILLFAL